MLAYGLELGQPTDDWLVDRTHFLIFFGAISDLFHFGSKVLNFIRVHSACNSLIVIGLF